ncbi:MAG: lipoprotein-releasing ABC transporter permease subunit [Sphingobacteriia bacterium]|nr:lipoprotein-releasing ABC transporter permease subunit [Sphingobacteriia bacterium]
MNIKLELKIALRYLHSKHKSGFISITSAFATIGILLGVATLIVVMSVMNGYRDELTRITLGVAGHVTVKGSQSGISYPQEVINQIKEIKEITKITPLIEKQVMMLNTGNSAGALIRGISNEDLKTKNQIYNNIVQGNIKDYLTDENSLLLGENLAQSIGVEPGDEVKIVTTNSIPTVLGRVPRFKTFKVAAIFRSGSYLYDNVLAFMQMDSAQLLFQMPGKISNLELMITDPTNSDKMTKIIAKKINRRYSVEDWKYQNSQILSALEIERAVMFLILTLIIIVAAFNIISSLYMLVYDKKYDIAVLRTIGAPKSMIIRIFVYMGTILGFGGTTFGVITGVLFAKNIERVRRFLESITSTDLFDPVVYYLHNLPAKVDYGDVRKIIIVALILCITATIFPALKAANVNPAEALRNE